MTLELKQRYDAWWLEREREFQSVDLRTAERNFDRIYRYLGRPGTGRVLDACCANGLFLSYLERYRRLSLYGMDIAPVAVASARSRVQTARLVIADAESLPYGDEAFDLITCLGSLEHLPDPERGAREISRVLRTGGRAVILVPNLYFLGHIYLAVRYGTYPSEGGQDFSEMFSTREGWAALLRRGGLRITAVHEYNQIGATRKVGKALIALWNMCKPIVPMGLCYSFVFICTKESGMRSAGR